MGGGGGGAESDAPQLGPVVVGVGPAQPHTLQPHVLQPHTLQPQAPGLVRRAVRPDPATPPAPGPGQDLALPVRPTPKGRGVRGLALTWAPLAASTLAVCVGEVSARDDRAERKDRDNQGSRAGRTPAVTLGECCGSGRDVSCAAVTPAWQAAPRLVALHTFRSLQLFTHGFSTLHRALHT